MLVFSPICTLIDIIIWITYKVMLRLFHAFRFSTYFPPNMHMTSSSSTFYANKLHKHFRKEPLPLPNFNDPASMSFGKIHTDHIITIDWDIKHGWHNPKLEAFHDLHLSPFVSGFHYGIQCYEGTKAYKNQKGEVRMFRPQCNAFRLKQASVRLTMPDFDGNEMVKLLEEFVRVQDRWIPPRQGCGLYIRPLHFGTDDALGVKKPDKTKMIIMGSPVGPYYATGYKAISLYCTDDFIRAAPKGTGHYKVGGNYAPTIGPAQVAGQHGHQQVLWLWQGKVLEVGSSNIFFVFSNGHDIQVVTPALEDLVLPGVTRDCILHILRNQTKYTVTERQLLMSEVIERHGRGELIQVFGTGTAVMVSSVKNIHYGGIDYEIPIDEQINFGMIAHKLRERLADIQEGVVEDPYGWTVQLK